MEYSKMKFTGNMFTGSMIEDLMASVERAEQRTQSNGLAEASASEAFCVEPSSVEPWFASAQENADYDSKLMGAA